MFRFLTAGESHGKGLNTIVEGVPAGLTLDEDFIARDLKRRQGGYGRGDRMKIEQDRAAILSGIRHGQTIGSPIALFIQNKDWTNWQKQMSVTPVPEAIEPVTRLRPGHADLAGAIKYNSEDVRPILERASARDTTARVAAGAVARRFLAEFGIEVHSHVLTIGGHSAKRMEAIDWNAVERSPVRCADPEAEMAMIAAIDEAKESGDTVGGIFKVIANGVPIGLGSHIQWDRRLSGQISQAVMSINGVKGVEIGDGFGLANVRGSQAHDVIQPWAGKSGKRWQRLTNHAGGLEGGITNGQPIVVQAVMKPIATLSNPLPSVDLLTGEALQAHHERSDVCVVPAAGVVGEAMIALVLTDVFLTKFGGDHLKETKRNYDDYIAAMELGE